MVITMTVRDGKYIAPPWIKYPTFPEQSSFWKSGTGAEYLLKYKENVENEEEIVNKAADEIGTTVVKKLPRDGHVQLAESQGKTVVDAFPESEMAKHYLELAEIILEASHDDEE